MSRNYLLLALGAIAAVSFVTVLDAEEVRFERRPPRANDVSRQNVQYDFALELAIRQHNQLVDASKQELTRRQERTLTILNVQDGKANRGQVTYQRASTHAREPNGEPVVATQSVAGKTYTVALRGEELVITDPLGQTPPLDELQIVRQDLQTFGRPNPLAAYLDGRIIDVGQSVVVPREVARELLGLTGNQVDAGALSLKLIATRRVDGELCGVFETVLRTANQEMGSISLLMKGELTIEAGSCRTRAIALRGPVAISEIRGPAEGRFTVSTNGTLQVAVTTDYESTGRR